MSNLPPARWRIRLLAAAVVFLGFVFLLLLGEGATRWLRPDLVPSNQLQTIPDPFIGWRFQPCQSLDARTEDGRRRRARINALGFADDDHDLEASPSTVRIAFLGDSFTAATHVDLEDSFVAVVRRALQAARPGLKIETLNFGQSGFGTVNEYLAWRHYAAPFHPRAVVLAFFLGNDVANNLPDYPTESFRSPKFELVRGVLRPIPFRMGAGEEALKRGRRSWFYRRFLAPSAFYQQYKLFARDFRAGLVSSAARPLRAQDAARPFWKRSYAPVDWQVYLRDPPPDFEGAWRVTEALLLQLRDEVRATGAQFHVALLPGVEALQPALFRASFPRYPGIEQFEFDLDWPRQRLAGFLEKQKIPAIDLTGEFQVRLKAAPATALYFKFDRHFSGAGHRAAGEAIARHLEKELMKTQP